MTTRRILSLLLGVAAVVVVLLAVQVARVHHETGELRLTPSAAPPELHEAGRLYRRSASTPTSSLPRGTQEVGTTAGGGVLFGPQRFSLEGPATEPVVPTVIWVRDDDGNIWSYGLVGGP